MRQVRVDKDTEAVLKTREEIVKMRETGRLVHKVIHETANHLIPGITTGELEDIAMRIMYEHGATSPCLGYAPGTHPPYPAWTCVSVNNEVVHGVPGRRAILEGDIVTIDVCAELNGWLADSAYTFGVGKISPQAERLLRVTKEALYKGITQARPGNRLGDIGYAVQRHAEANGYSVVRDLTGHGVGRTMHEGGLQVANYGVRGKGPLIQTGMTFAIEPMVNAGKKEIATLDDQWTIVTADGSLSAHFEHTVAITPRGAEILTEA